MFKDFKPEIKLFFLVAFIAVIISVGGIFLLRELSPAPTVQPTINNQQSTIDTSTWQTYRNDEFGFEIKIPADLRILKTNPSGIPTVSFCPPMNCAFSISIFDSQQLLIKSYGLDWQDAGIATVNGYQARKLKRAISEYIETGYLIDAKKFSITFEDPKFSHVNQETLDQILGTFRFANGE